MVRPYCLHQLSKTDHFQEPKCRHFFLNQGIYHLLLHQLLWSWDCMQVFLQPYFITYSFCSSFCPAYKQCLQLLPTLPPPPGGPPLPVAYFDMHMDGQGMWCNQVTLFSQAYPLAPSVFPGPAGWAASASGYGCHHVSCQRNNSAVQSSSADQGWGEGRGWKKQSTMGWGPAHLSSFTEHQLHSSLVFLNQDGANFQKVMEEWFEPRKV